MYIHEQRLQIITLWRLQISWIITGVRTLNQPAALKIAYAIAKRHTLLHKRVRTHAMLLYGASALVWPRYVYYTSDFDQIYVH